MTFGDLKSRTLKRLDQDPVAGGYFSVAEVGRALNRGQRIFAFLTLCLEDVVSFPLTPGTSFQHMLNTYADWIVPVRITCSGARVKPTTLADLYAYDDSWRTAAGSPTHYGCLGFDLLFTRGSSGTLSITYARMPATMSADADEPEIIEAFTPALIDYAIWRVRSKQGGQEFGKTAEYFSRFIEATKLAGRDVMKRAIAAGNDRLPFDLSRYTPETLGALVGGSK